MAERISHGGKDQPWRKGSAMVFCIVQRHRILNRTSIVTAVAAAAAMLIAPIAAEAQSSGEQGSTTPVGNISTFSLAGSLVLTGDFNNDGLLDVVVSSKTDASLSVFLAIDGDLFAPPTRFPLQDPGSIVVADLDGDGDKDIAVALPNARQIALIRNDGGGVLTFVARRTTVCTPDNLLSIIDADTGQPALLAMGPDITKPDVITQPLGAMQVTPVTIGFNMHDLQSALTQFGIVTEPYTNGDVDGDGVVTNIDINIILSKMDSSAATSFLFTPNCDSFTLDEPNCSASPSNPGTQECLRAAGCQFLKCRWAACVNYWSGGSSFFWYLQSEACTVVFLLDNTKCIPLGMLRIFTFA